MNKNARKSAVTGMFAAMIFVLTVFVKVPVASGYVHFGDALIYIAAMLLGSPWALIAGALGEGLADLFGYAVYAPATVIIKVLIALPFVFIRKKSDKLLSIKSAMLTIVSGTVTVGGYFVADLIIDRAYAVVDIWGNVIQAVGSAIIFIIAATAIDKAKIIDKIKF